jgi:glycosyltransferase involved in cell wall biosynthesis
MANQLRRILYIQFAPGGGSTVSLCDLVKGLDRHQYEPSILFINNNQYVENFNQLNAKTYIFNHIRYKYRKQNFLGNIHQFFLADIPFAIRIARFVKQQQIDLIHYNTGFDRAVMMAALMARIPIVCHYRSFYNTIPLISKMLLPLADGIVYTTRAISEHYLKLIGHVGKQAIVYEPIDIQRFSQHHNTDYLKQEFSINKNDYLISNIGRLTPWKGQNYFIQAIANIVKDYPNTKILIVGAPGKNSRDQQYFDSLQAMVAEMSLQNQVLFTGNRNDVPEIMAASDIVVHSACEPEPFGLVIAEAMAAGTPVIATRGGGTPEIIDDGVTGFLVPIKSADGIQSTIQKLLESKTLRESVSINAQKAVAERFSIKQHVTKVEKVYNEIFSKH